MTVVEAEVIYGWVLEQLLSVSEGLGCRFATLFIGEGHV
jgi:hypothetical protein